MRFGKVIHLPAQLFAATVDNFVSDVKATPGIEICKHTPQPNGHCAILVVGDNYKDLLSAFESVARAIPKTWHCNVEEVINP